MPLEHFSTPTLSSHPHEHGLHGAGLGPVRHPPLHHGALLLAVLASS